MTVKQASARLEVSAATIYGMVAAGKLRCIRVGRGRGVIRITEEHLEEFMRRAEPAIQAPPPPEPKMRFKHLRLS